MGEPKKTDISSQLLCERVTQLRQEKGFTLEQLAAASGVSRSMLSQIERGQANPTLAVTFRIGQAFGLSIGELVDDPRSRNTIEVIHGSDPNNLFRDDPECQIRTLSPLRMEKNIEFYELHLQAGAKLDSASHFEGTKELLTVVQGQVSVEAGETQCELAQGDSAHYPADVEHKISNTGKTAFVGYLVVTYK
ncbi:MAG: XRE family transcriptional regulator [Halioglobus sp.]